jgi:carboxylesterase type B
MISLNDKLTMIALSVLHYWACVLGSTTAESSSHLQIYLKTGIFAGIVTPNGTERWTGIPYAQPPLDILRFKAPLPPKASQEFRNASQFGNACPQPPSNALGAAISEDCLVLNVRSSA